MNTGSLYYCVSETWKCQSISVSAANWESIFPSNSNYLILCRGLKMLTSFLQTELAKSENMKPYSRACINICYFFTTWSRKWSPQEKAHSKMTGFSLMPSDQVSSMNSQTMQYHIPEDFHSSSHLLSCSICICYHALGTIFSFRAPAYNIQHLTFRNLASYIKDGHTATFNTPYFLYFFNKYTYWIFKHAHTLHFFLFKMPFIS
jgi:hypothetical protein